jgi:ADP-dependent NAD(P)H-hydrate dehydratase / NAD(P)H-hydrate epimerase
MQKLFDEVGSLDQRCFDQFGLNEDILTEHAANGMAAFIRSKFPKKSRVLVVCGSRNNGGDGITLSRLLFKDYDVRLFMLKEPKSPMAISQYKRVHAIGMKLTLEINKCDVLVDALFGTGFDGKLDAESKSVMQTINNHEAYKIACDLPSGLKSTGECDANTFVADVTLTMGALKKSMYSDEAKDFIGEVQVIDLGISRSLYETSSNWNLLDEEDMQLPLRDKKSTHKGNYGHLAVACGEKSGASFMSGLSALKFGTGLVTMISPKGEPLNIPHSLMHSRDLPAKTTALACGMGLGVAFSEEELKSYLDNSLPIIADADIFYMPIVLEILQRKNVVITPHLKEFASLLHLTGIADTSIGELQNDRFKYCEEFCGKYPNVTLLLKGANVIIGQNDKFFINSHGTSALAKGGSGDILSGLIGSLLAQGQKPLEASVNASLAHTKLAKNYKGADYSLTPEDLIWGIGDL